MRSSLVIVVALVGGCVDEAGPNRRNDRTQPGGLEDTIVVHRLVPKVCSEYRWDTLVPATKALDIAVVPRAAGGATVLAVPREGGNLTGFVLDGHGEIQGDLAGTKIRSDHRFTSVAAAITDGRLVANLVSDDGLVRVTAISDDLAQSHELAVLDGTTMTDLPIAHVRGERTTTVGGAGGLLAGTFTQAWTQGTVTAIAEDVPTAMTGTGFGEDTMIAWATGSSCTLERVASKVTSVRPTACDNPRLAADDASRTAEMMWEHGEHIVLTDIDITQVNELAADHELGKGREPRLIFDGTRYWGSYLNPAGDVVVGYLNDKASLSSTVIADVQPQGGSYDLVAYEGATWVFSADGAAFSAQRLCLLPE